MRYDIRWFGLSFLLLIGCGSAASVSRTVTLPPEVPVLRGPKSVHITAFQGARGDLATRRLTELLRAPTYHRLTNAGAAEVFISGKVAPEQTDDQTTKSESKRCVSRDKKGRCTKNVTDHFQTREQACTVAIDLEIAERGRSTAYTNRSAKIASRSDTYKVGSEVPATVLAKLCDEAAEAAVEELAEKLRASTDEFDLDFHEVADSAGDTQRAIGLARSGRLADAERIFADLVDSQELVTNDRQWSSYNAAVALFGRGEFGACAQRLSELAEPVRSSGEARSLATECMRYR